MKLTTSNIAWRGLMFSSRVSLDASGHVWTINIDTRERETSLFGKKDLVVAATIMSCRYMRAFIWSTFHACHAIHLIQSRSPPGHYQIQFDDVPCTCSTYMYSLSVAGKMFKPRFLICIQLLTRARYRVDVAVLTVQLVCIMSWPDLAAAALSLTWFWIVSARLRFKNLLHVHGT